MAAERTEEQLAELTRNLRLQALYLEDHDEVGFYREDERMHELIFSFTGYPRLNALAATAWVQVNRARQLLLPMRGRANEAYEEHKQIVEAIRNHEPESARRAMQQHLSELVTRLEPLARDRPDLFD
ncbi:FCD domain-containing protein [Roseibium salinum]|nr:FCD domain-containing protein [Roseibium salinum]